MKGKIACINAWTLALKNILDKVRLNFKCEK